VAKKWVKEEVTAQVGVTEDSESSEYNVEPDEEGLKPKYSDNITRKSYKHFEKKIWKLKSKILVFFLKNIISL